MGLPARLGRRSGAVQEAVVPAGLPSVYRAGGIAGRDGKARAWGSAVVSLSPGLAVAPIGLAEGRRRGKGLGLAPLDCVSRGHVAVGRVELDGLDVTLVSAYGLIEFGYASGSLLRTLADLEPLLDDPLLGDHVLLTGDWNIGTWWSGADHKYAEREGAALELLKAYGFVDCLDRHLPPDRGRLDGCTCSRRADCRHIWTYRKSGSSTPYMDDYVFATAVLAERMISVRVAEDWAWQRELSDRAPLVIDL